MKNIIKIMGIPIVGLIVAIVIYPLFHEMGHFCAALLVGARVVDSGLFPAPFVSCEVSGVGSLGLELIGLGGIFLPFIISLIFSSKNFWAWYGNFVLKYISLVCFIISFCSVVLYMIDVVQEDEDIVKIIDSRGEAGILLLLMLLSCWVAINSMLKQKPLDKLKGYFEISK